MHARPVPLDTPPDRFPYFGIVVDDAKLWMRTPSMHKIGQMIRSVDDDHRARLFGLVGMIGEGRSILKLAMAAPDVLELFGSLIGVAWADPVLELDTPAWSGGSLAAYGADVAEELHEAGWTLQHVALAGMRIADHARKSIAIDQEVTAEAAFFLRPKAPGTPNASRSSATPSAPTSVDTSET